MSEQSIIEKSPAPQSRESLARDLRALGLKPGMTVIVHSSLSRIGWVSGGEVAVIQALMDTVTGEGTMVMPAHSGNLSDPAGWGNPPVPESWWETVRATMPAYEAAVTPSWGMGRIAEAFRTMPGVRRSAHPQTSFSAWGANAEFITKDQSMHFGMGEQSPLARIYDLDGYVLLLGVGYENNTSFHLAEYRTPLARERTNYAPVMVDGKREWKELREIDFRTDDFEALGTSYENSNLPIAYGKIGLSDSKLFRQRNCVDFAVSWLSANPQGE